VGASRQMSLRFENVRLIDPEQGTETLGALRIENGVLPPMVLWTG